MNWKITPTGSLNGRIQVPGDKSITHRAYIIGALGEGVTDVKDPLRAEDTDNTLKAVKALGILVHDHGREVEIHGRGPEALAEPEDLLDLGNSGTGVRLMAGALATRPFLSVLTGDSSLRKRPMDRIATPLRQMGAHVDGRADGKLLPLVIRGGGLKGIQYISPVASAQIKSCVLLAALGAEGTTRFMEPFPSRDHTERMLDAMGVVVGKEDGQVVLEGRQVPRGTDIAVPGDMSSAAFFLAAAAVVQGSDVTVLNTGINPTRTGIIDLLQAMGADISIVPVDGGVEPRADIRVRGTRKLKGVRIPEEWIPSIIDEIPVAAVLGACAKGRTVITGAGELRVKESDRISATVEMLSRAGAEVSEEKTGFTIVGSRSLGTANYNSHGDHRIAMSSAILSMAADGESTVADTGCVATSFPDFPELMESLSPGCLSIVQDP